MVIVLLAVVICYMRGVDQKLFAISSVICVVFASYLNAISQVHVAIFHSAEKFTLEAKSSPPLAIGAFANWFVMDFYPSQPLFFFVLLLASLVHVGGTSFFLRKHFATVSLLSLLPTFCLRTILLSFRRSYSYAFIIACDFVYSSYDTIAVSRGYSLAELSLYEGFKRIVTVMTIPNVILSAWLTPRLVRLSVLDSRSSKVSLLSIWLLTSLVGLTLSVVYILFNEVIILFILDAKYLSITQFSWATVITVLLYYARIVPGCYYVARGFHSFRVAVSLLAAAVGYLFIGVFTGTPIGHQTVVFGYVSILFTIVFNALFLLKNKEVLVSCFNCMRRDKSY
jgi:O-antigen/teichoic acid export membrane protein